MAKEYTALVIPVEGPVYELAVNEDTSLETLQGAVGGYIQAVPLPGFIPGATRATAYVNEEGKFTEPFNGRATDFMVPGVGLFWGDHIAGAMVLIGFDPATGDHAALPPAVIERVRLIEREAA